MALPFEWIPRLSEAGAGTATGPRADGAPAPRSILSHPVLQAAVAVLAGGAMGVLAAVGLGALGVAALAAALVWLIATRVLGLRPSLDPRIFTGAATGRPAYGPN